MSEIKVNKLTPRTNCGTTTLGDSGDTINIPAGVTISNNGTATGFGATGSASWDTTVKTTDFTAVTGIGYFVNTTSGSINVTLPAGSAGDVIAIKDYAGTFATDNCILIQNGSDKIGGETDNATISTTGLAITLVYVDAVQGWLVTDDGLQSTAPTNPYLGATGGCITTCGDYKIHTFLSPATFNVTRAAQAAPNNFVDYVVVGGGGGGGGSCGNSSNGGGGAGGYRESPGSLTSYTASPLGAAPAVALPVSATGYPITVGGGGARSANTPQPAPGNDGDVSTFSTITSAGGGGGAGVSGPGAGTAGSGGSGGGAVRAAAVGSGNTPPTNPSQGNNGGSGEPGGPSFGGGGGGGASAVGQNSPSGTSGGAGGAGVASSITGSPVTRAGGGGGGSCASGAPTACGGAGNPGGTGGIQNSTPGGNGTTNAGGGGGGTGYGASVCAGNGGSGIVVIRYKYQ